MATASILESDTTASLPRTLPGQAADWFRRHAGFGAVLLFAIVFLSPMLRSGFYFDDIKNSCISGFIRLYDSNLAAIIEQCTLGLMQTGRLFPGALAITQTVHFMFPDAAAYKVVLLALTLVNLVQFYALLRCWKVDPPIAQSATLALVLLMQMRAFADPLLGFAGIMQVVAGQLLLSLICLQRYLVSTRPLWLAASVVIYVSSLLTYEISYLFLPVYLALAFAHRYQWRQSLKTAGPYALVTVVLACYVLGLRYSVPMAQDFPYRFSLAPMAVAGTTLRAASAALPLSYALLSPHGADYFDAWRVVSRWENWMMACAAGTLTWGLLRKISGGHSAGQGPPLRLLFAAGLLLWILPGLAIAVSPKYQGCVLVGVGYLPVYVQYCGIPLIAMAGLLGLAGRFPAIRGRLAGTLVLTSFAVTLITFDTNRCVVDTFPSTTNCRGQQLAEAAFKAGLANGIPESATVITTKGEPIDLLDEGPPVSSSFMTQCLRRKINSISEVGGVAARPLSDQLASLKPATFVLSVHCLNARFGYVILGAIDQPGNAPGVEDADIARRSVRRIRVYIRGTPISMIGECAGSRLADWQADREAPPNDSEQQGIDISQLRLTQSGPDWAIYEGSLGDANDLAKADLHADSASELPRSPVQVSMAESADSTDD